MQNTIHRTETKRQNIDFTISRGIFCRDTNLLVGTASTGKFPCVDWKIHIHQVYSKKIHLTCPGTGYVRHIVSHHSDDIHSFQMQLKILMIFK